MSEPNPQNVDPPGDDSAAEVGSAPGQAFREASSQIGELKEYIWQYVSAKIDLAKLSLRRMIIWMALGIVALFMALTAVITLVVLLLSGLAELVASWLGGRAWAGDLIVGGGFLLTLAGACWIGLNRLSRAWHDATVRRYERRHAQQRNRLDGHDAQQRDAEYASKSSHGN